MELFLVLSIVVVTFLVRVINLGAIPIFTDEAIYIRWAQIGLADPVNRYLSLTDGKQPLMTWLMYPFLALLNDPLIAGRIVSVIAGVGSVVGIYLVARELFGKKTAAFACLIYIISPFFMVYDRLALMDSLLAMFSVWSLYLEILLVRKLRLDIALLLGMTIGGGMITKSSAQFFALLMPFSLLLYRVRKNKNISRLSKWVGLTAISSVIVFVMYNSLRLSPWFYIIDQKNHVFIYSFSEFFKNPFAVFLPNLHGLLLILNGYLTLPISILVALGVLYGFIRRDRRVVFLFLWFIIPFTALAVFGKVIFPRFILFMVIPLFIIASDLVSHFTYFSLKKLPALLIMIPVVFFYPAFQTYTLMTDPVQSDIPVADRNQLFDEWPSGFGVKEVITYLKNEAEDKKIVVGTEGTFGLNPAVYEIYMGLNKNVEIHGYWPVSEVPPELRQKAKTNPTYLIFKEREDVPTSWPLELIAKYQRGKGNTHLLFYKVKAVEEN